jgi:hypothetical protein
MLRMSARAKALNGDMGEGGWREGSTEYRVRGAGCGAVGVGDCGSVI